MVDGGEKGPGWTLSVGPGRRLAGLAPLLERLAPARPGGPDRIQSLGELDELSHPEPRSLRLVLDADELPLEELGFVRRALARQVRLEVVLVGEDPSRRSARRLLREGRARWLAWPLDLDELDLLLGRPADEREAAAPSASASSAAWPDELALERQSERGPDPEPGHELDPRETLEAIRSVLDAPLPREGEVPPAWLELEDLDEPELELAPLPEIDEDDERTLEDDPPPDAVEPELDLELDELPLVAPPVDEAPLDDADDPFAGHARAPEPALDEEHDDRRGAPTVLVPRPSAPPPWFRRQIADLADLAQRLDLALEDLRAEHDTAGELEPLEGEVARLVQFTRTLGFLVAPPPPGRQRIDLAQLVEEQVQGLVQAAERGPRCLLRRRGETFVQSDKGLLVAAFDAFLVLAARCSEAGDVIRVQTAAEEQDGARLVRVSIDFPEGPLEALEPERLVEPYALRELLPDVGPNALRAALGIVSGQGGRARLDRSRPGRLAWSVELPGAPA